MRLLYTVLTLFSLHAEAQHFIKISGTILDGETNEVLPFASINLKGTSIGTIANMEGKFSINLPDRYWVDTLYVNVLGYHAMQLPIRSMDFDKNNILKLEPSRYYLEGVTVADSLSAEVILKRAYDNLKMNYSNRPFLLRGFYREIQKADSSYVFLIECSVKLYSDGFKTNRNERLQVDQLRRSMVYEHPINSFWNRKNLLWHFLRQNFVKYSKGQLIGQKELFRKENSFIDSVPVYVVVVGGSGFWPTILYVRCDNYAIIRTEENFDQARDGAKSWKVNGAPLVTSHPKAKLLRIDFKEVEGKYYPYNYLMRFNTIYSNAITDEKLLDFQIDQQFVVTEIDNHNPVEIRSADALKEDDYLGDLVIPYDSSFWEHFNIVIDSRQDSIIQHDLRKRIETQNH